MKKVSFTWWRLSLSGGAKVMIADFESRRELVSTTSSWSIHRNDDVTVAPLTRSPGQVVRRLRDRCPWRPRRSREAGHEELRFTSRGQRQQQRRRRRRYCLEHTRGTTVARHWRHIRPSSRALCLSSISFGSSPKTAHRQRAFFVEEPGNCSRHFSVDVGGLSACRPIWRRGEWYSATDGRRVARAPARPPVSPLANHGPSSGRINHRPCAESAVLIHSLSLAVTSLRKLRNGRPPIRRNWNERICRLVQWLRPYIP